MPKRYRVDRVDREETSELVSSAAREQEQEQGGHTDSCLSSGSSLTAITTSYGHLRDAASAKHVTIVFEGVARGGFRTGTN